MVSTMRRIPFCHCSAVMGGMSGCDRFHRRFLQYAARLALRVAVDGAGGRIFRLGSDVGETQRLVIRDPIMARRMHEPDGIVRGSLIEI